MSTIYLQSDNLIELATLTDAATAAVLTDATVTVTILDAGGNSVSGETWPKTMSHVSAGLYRASLSDSLSLSENGKYTARVVATSAGGVVRTWKHPLVANYST